MNDDTKRCAKCGEVKALEEFHRHASGSLGRRSICKSCRSLQAAAAWAADPEAARAKSRARYAADPKRVMADNRKWLIANRERVRESERARYAADPERRRAMKRARYAAGPETQRERLRAWRAANPATARASTRKWREENTERVRELSSVRRARKRNAPVVERVYRAVVWARDGGRCHICGKPCDPNNWHLEHIIPLARGGEHSYRNVAVSHPACNLRKGVSGPAQARLLP